MVEVSSQPHRRYNPLSGEWILVSAQRTSRPWHGDRVEPIPDDLPPFDPDCHLCPGNSRSTGAVDPTYEGTFVFTNDFAALIPEAATKRVADGLLLAEGERGTCRVVCYTPRHDASLGQLDPTALRGVIDLWAAETTELGTTYRWVQSRTTPGSSSSHSGRLGRSRR